MSIDLEAAAAGGLALDILQNGLHLPLKDGKINRDKIEDQITIGLYSNDLDPISENVVEIAIATVQDLVDINMAEDK